MSRKGWYNNSYGHKLAAKGIQSKDNYSTRYKYKVMQDIRENMEKLQKQLEKQGYKVEIIRDSYKGIVINIDNHEIIVYPSVTNNNKGFAFAYVTVLLPEDDNLRGFVTQNALNELHKRKLSGWVEKHYDNAAIIRVETKKIDTSTDANREIVKILNAIESIDKITGE